MKRKVVSVLLVGTMLTAALLSGCGGGSGSGSSSGGSTTSGSTSSGSTASTNEGGSDEGGTTVTDLTAEEQEAVDAGLINLDGSLPIITDTEAFNDKYGKISMLFVNSAARTVPVEDLAIVQRWKEETGIEFEWVSIPGEGAVEKINLIISGGSDIPNVFWNFTDGQSGNTVVQYADQGVFVPTEALIDDYMPNLKKVLEDHPQYDLETTAPNGHKYGFPYIEEMYGLVLTPGPWIINQEWINTIKENKKNDPALEPYKDIDVPTTVDEYHEVLLAFKAAIDSSKTDLNGDDDPNESGFLYPMANQFGAEDTFGSYNMFYRFTGAFGCADSYCHGNEYADHLRIIDGKVTFTATDEAFRKTAEFFHTLYSEGLIWDGSFEADDSASYHNTLVRESVSRIGSFGCWTDQEISDIAVHDQYVPLPRLEGENGMTGFACNYSQLQDSSNTAITTTCKFPHVVAKFVDYIVGNPELSVLSNWGPANYQQDEEGIWKTPLDENGNYITQDESLGTNFGDCRTNSTPCRGSMIVLDEYYADNDEHENPVCGYTYDAVKLLDWQRVNGKEDILAEYETIPRVLMEQSELNTLSQIQPTISDIVDRYINTWTIEGVTDDNWNAYLSELDGAGVQQIVDIYQTATDRAEAATGE